MPPQTQPLHDWSCLWNDTEGEFIEKSFENCPQATLTMNMLATSHQSLLQIASPG